MALLLHKNKQSVALNNSHLLAPKMGALNRLLNIPPESDDRSWRRDREIESIHRDPSSLRLEFEGMQFRVDFLDNCEIWS